MCPQYPWGKSKAAPGITEGHGWVQRHSSMMAGQAVWRNSFPKQPDVLSGGGWAEPHTDTQGLSSEGNLSHS